MKAYSDSFIQGCRMSALFDDEKISLAESEELNKIERLTKEYIRQLNKLIKK